MERRASPAWLLILAYVPLLGLLALLPRASTREVRWHAKNGFLLFVAVGLLAAVATLIGILIPQLPCLYGVVMLLAACVYGVVLILSVVKALQGERVIVPGISKYADRF
jgi:uncharacterized membrane protein